VIEDWEKYPNNLLVFVYAKIPDVLRTKGSGCLLSNKYVLTCGHNVEPLLAKKKDMENRRLIFVDGSLIFQGLKEKCNC
jgi:hypothetical protein